MQQRSLFRARTRNVARFRNAKRAGLVVAIAAVLLALPHLEVSPITLPFFTSNLISRGWPARTSRPQPQ